jgi:hypothetical protein
MRKQESSGARKLHAERDIVWFRTSLSAGLEFTNMTKMQTGNQYRRFKTSELVVYPMLVVILIGVAFGFYHNSEIEDAVSAAVDLGQEQKVIIEEYFETFGKMPQSKADINLDALSPEGILIGMDYQAGELGVPAADKLRTGTLGALVDMSEFGTRFEEIKSGYLLIARAQDEGTIKWDCVADHVSVDALDKRYLPETCKDEDDEEDEEEGRGDG